MPGGDKTGPWGLGPKTGRAAGYCAGYNIPGHANPEFGQGFARGFCRMIGRGFWGRRRNLQCRGFYPCPTKNYPETYFPKPAREDERKYLEDMVKTLEDEIKMIRDRLQELSKEKKENQK